MTAEQKPAPQREEPKRAFRSIAGGAGVSTPSLGEIPAKPKEKPDGRQE